MGPAVPDATLRVALFVERRLFAEAFEEVLRRTSGVEMCGLVRTAGDCLRLVDEVQPSVIVALADVRTMIHVAERVRPAATSMLIVVNRLSIDEEQGARRAGVRAIVSSDRSVPTILEMMRRCSEPSDVLLVDATRLERPSSVRLTAREREVFELVEQGCSTAAIAASLGISPNTASTRQGDPAEVAGAKSPAGDRGCSESYSDRSRRRWLTPVAVAKSNSRSLFLSCAARRRPDDNGPPTE